MVMQDPNTLQTNKSHCRTQCETSVMLCEPSVLVGSREESSHASKDSHILVSSCSTSGYSIERIGDYISKYDDRATFRSTRKGSRVVVKTFHKRADAAVLTAHHESKALKACSTSPFVVQLNETFQDENYLYILLDDKQGCDLHTYIKNMCNGGHLTIRDVRFVLVEVLLGVRDLHAAGYIHRDLKHENILLDSSGSVSIGDLGLAHPYGCAGRCYDVQGTPGYFPPELLLGEGVGPKGDVFALGVMLFEMISGTSPFLSNDDNDFSCSNIFPYLHRVKAILGKLTYCNSGHPDAVTDLVKGMIEVCSTSVVWSWE